MRIASRQETRWTKRAATWNPGLSIGAKTCRAVGRPKKEMGRWRHIEKDYVKKKSDPTENMTTESTAVVVKKKKPHCGSCTHGSHSHMRCPCLAKQKSHVAPWDHRDVQRIQGRKYDVSLFAERRDACQHATCRRYQYSRRTTFQIYGLEELKQLRTRVCHTPSSPSPQESEDSTVWISFFYSSSRVTQH